MMPGEGVARWPGQAHRAGEGRAKYSRDRLELNRGAGRFRVPVIDRQLRDAFRHLHALGPRPVGELVLALARDPQRLMPLLDDAKRWSPEEMEQLNARDWLELPLWVAP